MRPAASLLVRAYPARWRARYGDEFLSVLEERPLGPFDVADVLLGALDAHLHLRGLGAASEHGKGFAMSLRIGGYAAILGGVLWLLALAGNAINNGAEAASPLIFITLIGAMIATLVALIGLSAFQSRRHPVLVWTAFAVPAAGAAVGLFGFAAMAVAGDSEAPTIGGFEGWVVMSFGVLTLLLGSVLFAIATWSARSLSRGASALLGVGALLVLPAIAGVTGGLVPEALVLPVLMIAILAFPAGWMALGVSALRLGSPTFSPIEGASL
jgi:hypothetical protein